LHLREFNTAKKDPTDVILTFDLDDELSTRFAANDKASGVVDPQMGAFGPREGYKEVLRILDEYKFPSTFFVVGKSVFQYSEAVTKIVEMGHEIGNHSFSHRSYKDLSRAEVFEEVSKANASIKEVAGVEPQGHRSPYWHENKYLSSLLEELGFKWNGDAHCEDITKTYQPEWKIENKILEIPSSTYQGDWTNFLIRKKSADEVLDLWLKRLEVVRSYSAVYTLVCHPFIIGRKEFISALEGFLFYLSNNKEDYRVITGLQLFNKLVQKASSE
jgi:peptidoglycan-N-acetylglucosamine deacetylase